MNGKSDNQDSSFDRSVFNKEEKRRRLKIAIRNGTCSGAR